jgi:hypothetical protein
VIFDGKILSKQAEILSSCGKGQGQHMEKNQEKNIRRFFLAIFFRGPSFYSADGRSIKLCLSHIREIRVL